MIVTAGLISGSGVLAINHSDPAHASEMSNATKMFFASWLPSNDGLTCSPLRPCESVMMQMFTPKRIVRPLV